MRAPNPKLLLARSDVSGVGWPPIHSGVAASIVALLHRLEQTQWLPAEVLAERQRRQLAILVRWFAPRSPWVAQRLAAAGLAPEDLVRPGALEALPILGRRELQALGPSLFVDVPPEHRPVREGESSGSTGERVVVHRTEVTRVFFGALAVRDYFWRADLELRGGFAVVRSNVEPQVRPTWGWPMDPVFTSGPCQVISTTTSVDEILDLLAAFRPTVMLSYPTVIRALCELRQAGGHELPLLRWVQAIGETVPPDLEQLVADTFGARFWDVYSSEELGYIACRCPDGPGSHVMAESVLVEVVDDDDQPVPAGAEGRVIVTDLHNLATPLLRYDLGDRAIVGAACGCGRGLPVIERVLGRERNLVVLPDGSRHWPVIGLVLGDLRAVAPVEQLQLIQRRLDLVEVLLVVGSPLSAEQEAAVAVAAHTALGYPFPLQLTYVEGRLSVGPRGKFEQFRCEVAAAPPP